MKAAHLSPLQVQFSRGFKGAPKAQCHSWATHWPKPASEAGPHIGFPLRRPVVTCKTKIAIPHAIAAPLRLSSVDPLTSRCTFELLLQSKSQGGRGNCHPALLSEHNGLIGWPLHRSVSLLAGVASALAMDVSTISLGKCGLHRAAATLFVALEMPPRAARSKREAKAKAAGLAPATSKGIALPVGSGARAARAGFASSPRLVSRALWDVWDDASRSTGFPRPAATEPAVASALRGCLTGDRCSHAHH